MDGTIDSFYKGIKMDNTVLILTKCISEYIILVE